MVPVDMCIVGKEIQDVEDMVKVLGAKGAAQAFIQAEEYFNTFNQGFHRTPMTAWEWERNAMDELGGEDSELSAEDFGHCSLCGAACDPDGAYCEACESACLS